MSVQDKSPADTARPVTPPVFFYGNKELPENMVDWRPKPIPADAPDEEAEPEVEEAPKAESAPAPVVSYESPKVTEPEQPVTPVPPPAVEVGGPPKPVETGKPTSSRKVVTRPGA